MLDAEKYSAANVSPQFFEGERQAIALREATELVSLRGDGDQLLAGLHLNRDYSSNLAIVWLNGMFEDVQSLSLRYAGYQLAAANPENPILVINIPAHGQADPLTPAQRQEILSKKQLSLVAASQAMAASRRLPQTSQVVVAGQSAGARLAPDFAVAVPELDIQPKALVGFNMAGLDKRPTIASSLAFLLDGYLLQYKYHRGAADRRLDEAMEVRFRRETERIGFYDQHNALVNDYRVLRQDPSYAAFLLAGSPLAADTGFTAIEQAMNVNAGLQAALVSAGLDKVTRWRKIEPRARQLANAYPGRLSWDVWPNDRHAMGIATQSPRIAAAIKSVIAASIE